MAFKRRKEAVERQIKEHTLAKQQQQQASTGSKCPFSQKESEKPGEQAIVSEQANATNTNEANKKYTVTIQTTEDMSKENVISNSCLIFILLRLLYRACHS